MIKQTLLLVDDEPDILEALTSLLQEEGYTILTNKGNNVEKKVEETMPDLVLLDVLLADKNGGDITRHLKQNRQTANVPIVLMSAYPNAEKLTEESGADGFLAKPFEMQEIIQEIKKLIG